MKETQDFYIFENNIKFSKHRYSKKQAECEAKKMINCFNCTNSVNCNNCINCNNCEDCYSCINCFNCTNSVNCINCISCDDCDRCNNCDNCTDLIAAHNNSELINNESQSEEFYILKFFRDLKINTLTVFIVFIMIIIICFFIV